MDTTRSLSRIYAILLCFSPSRFRREFGPEIIDTFTSALEDASQESHKEFTATCLREFRDYFPNLINAYLVEGGIVMDKILSKKNPLRSAQAGAAGFGIGFMLMGLGTGLFRIAPASLTEPALSTLYLVDLVLTSILIGAVGGAVLVYSVDPRRAKQCAFLCAVGYLLGTLFTQEVGAYGIAENLPLLASLVYATPYVNGALMGVCISWNLDLKKRAPILILSGVASFEIGSQLSRLSWVAMGNIFSNLGLIFPPSSDFVFLLTWITSSVVFGIVAGGLFGTAVGIFAQGRNNKINAVIATE